MYRITRYAKDPLYKNSFFIMLTSISSAGFGFVFWLLAARLYPKEDVGIATTLISSMALLVLLSRFGLDFSIIRFFPERDKSSVFSTSAVFTTLFAVLLGIIFIAGVDLWSPALAILKSRYAVLYVVFLAARSVISLSAISFIAMRRAEFCFLQSLIVGSRVVFLFPLIPLGAIGIFAAGGASFVLAFAVALLLLVRSGIKPVFKADRGFLNDAFHFSAANYVADLLMVAPNMILPIMVLNVLGAEEAARYYIAFAIVSLLFMIPGAVSASLFVEGSHGEALKKTTIQSLLAVFSLLIPAIAILYFAGGWLLGLIGEDYVEALELLRLMILSSFFAAVVLVYFSIKRVQKDVKGLVVLSGLFFALLVGLSYAFMLAFGLGGIGYAWMLSYGIGVAVVGAMVWREKWI